MITTRKNRNTIEKSHYSSIELRQKQHLRIENPDIDPTIQK